MAQYEVKYNILETFENNRSVIAVEPLEQGYGQTLGNALRRVMLRYLYGAAITRLKVNNVPHEFSQLKGVHEDVVELVQNLKGVNFKMIQPKTHIVTLDVTGNSDGEKEITAGDLKCPTGIEVVNKDHHIATLSDKKSKLSMELTVEYGQGYELPDEREKRPLGVIFVDANYSPVTLVSYKVEETRVGRVTNLDRLVMDVTTNGAITPKEAIQRAAANLNEMFSLLAGDEIEVTHPDEQNDEDEIVKPKKVERKVYLEELNLPTRVLNTLKKSGYETLSDLKGVTEEDLRKIKNIGPKTIDLLLEKTKEIEE